jgi:hypothetical protein
MTKLEAIITKYYGEEIVIADGFDDAVIGIEENAMRLVYSSTKYLEILESKNMSQEEVLENFYFNTESSLETIIATYPDAEILVADGFDRAVIGIEENTMRVVYSVHKCVYILIAEGMPEEDALEYFYFKVLGAYVGDKTPIFCFDDFKDME